MSSFVSPRSEMKEFIIRMNHIFGDFYFKDNNTNEEHNIPLIYEDDEDLLDEPMF